MARTILSILFLLVGSSIVMAQGSFSATGTIPASTDTGKVVLQGAHGALTNVAVVDAGGNPLPSSCYDVTGEGSSMVKVTIFLPCPGHASGDPIIVRGTTASSGQFSGTLTF